MRERKKSLLPPPEQRGGEEYEELANKEFPTIKIPSRPIPNILSDKKTRQYILGNRNVKRSARNVRHIRPFTQLLWTAMFTDELTGQNKTSTLRDVFYSAQDRKSTRLNSSHANISYAVFCLKKKTK